MDTTTYYYCVYTNRVMHKRGEIEAVSVEEAVGKLIMSGSRCLPMILFWDHEPSDDECRHEIGYTHRIVYPRNHDLQYK